MPHRLKIAVSDDFHAALAFASALHASQARKGTQIPYVAHLLAVASIVLEAGGDECEAIAALLHDGAEDQGGEKTLATIRASFGDAVAGIVAECSDTFDDPKPAWEKRKGDYIERLRTASASALLVSAADKLHNAKATLRDRLELGDAVWKRFSASREQLLGNYRSLIVAYEGGTNDPRRGGIVRDLRNTINELAAA